MTAREGWWLVPFEPSPETVIRIGWISAALGFLIAIVSAIGEVLGWWGLLGEIGMTVGSLLGIVATFTTLSFTAGRDQVAAVRKTIEGVDESMASVDDSVTSVDDSVASVEGTMRSVQRTIESVDEATARNNAFLQDNNEKLGGATVTLERIEAALVEEDDDGRTSKLDVVQAELDRQTGVLGRQVQILEAIRDGI